MASVSNAEMRPHLGADINADFNRRFLLVCFFDPNGIATVWENIAILQKYSCYKFEILNLWPGRSGFLEIPSSVDLSDYVGLMIHPTAAYNPDNLNNLDRNLRVKFKEFDGIKILAKQDEHYRSAEFPIFFDKNSFDILLTCIPDGEINKVYNDKILRNASVIHTLTGYVSEAVRNINSPPYEARRVDIAYRGSLQPISFGRLGYEKRQVGAQVLAHPAARNLTLDISSRWEDRLSGLDWFSFLGGAKAILGVESGSNLFDFDGSVAEQCRTFALEHSDMDPFSDDFYRIAEAGILRNFEGNVTYAQISPRHFEAAATRSVQIMFEGAYSNIFQPGKHFFPLKRDLSNFEEAVDFIKDTRRATAMVEVAYEEIILNDNYTYKNFVLTLDKEISDKIEAKGARRNNSRKPSASAKPKALILCAHDPVVDPRIGWWASSLNPAYSVCELGTYRFSETGEEPRLSQISETHWRVQIERTCHGSVWKSSDSGNMLNTPGVRDIALLDIFSKSSEAELRRSLGAFDANDVDFYRFKELCRYFVNTNSALLQAALNMGPFDCLICADLESLPAAAALKHIWKCHVVFDSHEYWPFSYTDFRAWENEFWSRLEGRLAASVDRCITVSDTLAAHLTSEYGLPFKSIPNATLLADANAEWFRSNDAEEIPHANAPLEERQVVFLFQGNFAPGRGLDLLVDAWKDVHTNAILHLRGPENAFRDQILELSRQNNTLNRNIFFQPAVSESELIDFARKADVGIIPYDSRHYANKFACPNKMSQYMAAGIPILSNKIEYVSGIIESNGIGESIPFHERDQLIELVNTWTLDERKRTEAGAKARSYFEKEFNWENISRSVVQDLDKIVSLNSASSPPIRFEWIARDQSMRKAAPEFGPSEVTPDEPSGEITSNESSCAILKPLDTKLSRVLRGLWRSLPSALRYRIAASLRRSGILR